MIFQSVLRRAEAAIDNVVEQALARVLIALPLLVAAGFGTAALSTYVNARFGAQNGHLVMAGGFAVLGLLAMLYVSLTAAPARSDGEATDAAGHAQGEGSADSSAESSGTRSDLSDSERELFTAVLASAAPIAVPSVVRTLVRNLPLVLVVLIVAFVLSRSTTSNEPDADESEDVDDEKRKFAEAA